MSSLLFGSSKSETEIPGWLKDAATEMLSRSTSLGKTGFMPWAGPDVAALTPDQLAARDNTNSAASAFGLNVGGLGTPGATDFGNGIWGHSSLPMYEQQQDWMQENRPGQHDFYNSHFVDPVTGAPGANMTQGQQAGQGQGDYWSDEARRQRAMDDVLTGHLSGQGANMGQSNLPSMQGPQQPGYTGLSDMFNGGGPGASGPTYQGGGLLSDFGNARNKRNDRSPGGIFGGWF